MDLPSLTALLFISLVKLTNSYNVYWNIPTELCKTRYNMSFEYVRKEFGITMNKGDFFRGNEISLLYTPGLFPEIKGYKHNYSLTEQNLSNLTYINGGLPQDGNMTRHLEVFATSLKKLVPDINNEGLIVIDMEHFGGTWQQNFNDMEIYKIMSRKQVEKRHPLWPKSLVEMQAKHEYDKGAMNFLDRTIEYAKTLRPKAKWGYYQYPQCFNPVGVDFCSTATQNDNNKMVSLYRISDALYPSLYLANKGTVEGRAKQIKGHVKEAFRVMKLARKPSLNVPYIWYKYYFQDGEVSDADMENLIGVPKAEGANGVIVWGSSGDISNRDKCQHLDNYVRKSLGPIAKKYID